jgi:putative nucleotidyltransferase with HDIG domain
MSSAKKFIDKFSDIQPLPHVVTRLSKLIADSNSTIREFEAVIKMDPILVVRILRLVNSPFYGLSQKVDSISRAVAFIGMKNLHNLAITDALKTMFTDTKSSMIFSRKQIWLHSAAVSICCKMVAERIFGINGDDAYLSGILHDFGIIVEEQVKHEEFIALCQNCSSSALMVEHERRFFDTDHCEIGYHMCLEWAMPKTIQEAIRNHHTMLAAIAPESLTGILQISEYLVGQLGHTTLPNMTMAISPPLLAHIEENYDEYAVLLEDFPEEMAKAQDVYSVEG